MSNIINLKIVKVLLPSYDFEIFAGKRYSAVKIYFDPSQKNDVEGICIPLSDFFMNHHIGLQSFANIKIQYASIWINKRLKFYLDINKRFKL